jgi:hypothetical protein
VTDPTPPESDPPVEIAWDPEGDQLAAVVPVTVTADVPSRGGQRA